MNSKKKEEIKKIWDRIEKDLEDKIIEFCKFSYNSHMGFSYDENIGPNTMVTVIEKSGPIFTVMLDNWLVPYLINRCKWLEVIHCSVVGGASADMCVCRMVEE